MNRIGVERTGLQIVLLMAAYGASRYYSVKATQVAMGCIGSGGALQIGSSKARNNDLGRRTYWNSGVDGVSLALLGYGVYQLSVTRRIRCASFAVLGVGQLSIANAFYFDISCRVFNVTDEDLVSCSHDLAKHIKDGKLEHDEGVRLATALLEKLYPSNKPQRTVETLEGAFEKLAQGNSALKMQFLICRNLFDQPKIGKTVKDFVGECEETRGWLEGEGTWIQLRWDIEANKKGTEERVRQFINDSEQKDFHKTDLCERMVAKGHKEFEDLKPK